MDKYFNAHSIYKIMMNIEAIYKHGVFKPLKKVNLKEGTILNIKISKNEIIELAKKFSGIGGYKGKLDADKLRRIEADIFG